jgi:hypothetical protein
LGKEMTNDIACVELQLQKLDSESIGQNDGVS